MNRDILCEPGEYFKEQLERLAIPHILATVLRRGSKGKSRGSI